MGYASENGFKTCNKCKESKPFSCFSKTKAGHGDRFNLRSKCKECRAAENLAWHQKNAAKSHALHMKWLENNKEKVLADAKLWREKNADRHKQNNSLWKKKNPTRNAANASRLKATKLMATPKWLSSIELAQIQEFYDIAAAKYMQTGIKYHVDHIHPLMGEGFTGLHVPWNLRVITAKDNIAKKNRIPVEESNLFWSV